MSLVLAVLAPHPPIVVPEVGRGEERQAQATVSALESMAAAVAGARPERLLLISPHAPFLGRGFYLRGQAELKGDLATFGAPEVRLELPGEPELAGQVADAFTGAGLASAVFGPDEERRYGLEPGLDHGAMVPLSYLWRAGVRVPVLEMGIADLPPRESYRAGEVLGRLLRRAAPRTVLVASGDLSHRLFPGAPAGYDPGGRDFDQTVMQALGEGRTEELLSIDPARAEAAGECGFRSLLMALGALDEVGFTAEVLSYEGPWGVGYGVAILRLGRAEAGEGPLPRLAREALTGYLGEGRLPAPGDLPDLPSRAGVFVTLKKDGRLRGCIGTTGPTQPTLGEEIVRNAISAGLADPRFPPVVLAELAELEISVDVLAEPEPVHDHSELDPEVYGVIVRKG